MQSLTDFLERARGLAEKATAGQWYIAETPGGYVRSKAGNADYGVCQVWGGHGPNRSDADFIAASRTLVPQLLEIVEVMQRALKAECFCIDDDSGPVRCDPCEALARCEEIAKGEP